MGGVTNISANRTDSDWEQTCQTHNKLTDRKCRLLVLDNVTYLYSGVANWGHCDSLHQVALLDAFPSGKDEKRVAQKKTRLRLQTITGENIQNSNCGNCDDTQCQESQKQTNIRQSRPQVVGLDLLTSWPSLINWNQCQWNLPTSESSCSVGWYDSMVTWRTVLGWIALWTMTFEKHWLL